MDCEDISYQIVQKTSLRAGGKKWHGSKVIAKKTYKGCKAGDESKEDVEVELKKCGKDLIPSCKVKMITNRHEQEIKFKMGGCYCSEHPELDVPITIAKSKAKPFFGFIQPPGAEATPMANVNIKVPDYKHA